MHATLAATQACKGLHPVDTVGLMQIDNIKGEIYLTYDYCCKVINRITIALLTENSLLNSLIGILTSRRDEMATFWISFLSAQMKMKPHGKSTLLRCHGMVSISTMKNER